MNNTSKEPQTGELVRDIKHIAGKVDAFNAAFELYSRSYRSMGPAGNSSFTTAYPRPDESRKEINQ